jgi:hypothetical protein
MLEPLWAFLIDLPPLRRRVTAAVDRAVEEESRAAHKIIDKLRERQDAELRRYEERIASLQQRDSELRRQVDELQVANERLREESAWHRAEAVAAGEALLAMKQQCREQQDAEATRNDRTETDLFACTSCRSIWQMDTRPDDTCSVTRPHGKGCRDCLDRPLERLWSIRTGEIAGPEALPAEPAEPITSSATAEVPEDDETGVRIASKFVADLIEGGLDSAVAKGVVREFGEYARNALWPADRCKMLAAIANGLAPIPTTVKAGFTWFATGIVGLPRLVAETISEIATRVLVEPVPLRALARAVRIVGVMSCAAEDRLAQCCCVRDLVGKDLTEPQIASRLEKALHDVDDTPASPEPNAPGKAAITGSDDPSRELQPPQVPESPRPNLDFPRPRTFGPGDRW